MTRQDFERIFEKQPILNRVGLFLLRQFVLSCAGRFVMAMAMLAAFALSGCTTLPYNPADMSAEQLTAAAKDKNASVVCAIGNTPYGRAVIVTVNLDQKVIVQGTVTVDDTCKTTITNAVVPK